VHGKRNVGDEGASNQNTRKGGALPHGLKDVIEKKLGKKGLHLITPWKKVTMRLEDGDINVFFL